MQTVPHTIDLCPQHADFISTCDAVRASEEVPASSVAGVVGSPT